MGNKYIEDEFHLLVCRCLDGVLAGGEEGSLDDYLRMVCWCLDGVLGGGEEDW